MLVISSALVLSAADAALPEGTPRILWDNIVTFGTIAADSEATGYPASNMANPATNQEWRAEAAGDVELAITVSDVDDQSGVGIARHNFGTAGIAVSVWGTSGGVDSYTKLLLHFAGADASTSFVDSSPTPKTFTANGNAQIDTAEFKFDGSSGLFDGTGDYITTADHADLALASSDFTIDFWFNRQGGDGTRRFIFGQANSGSSGVQVYMELNASNLLSVNVRGVDTLDYSIASTTTFTAVGWHHAAIVRTGNVLKLFVDGVQESGNLAIAVAVVNSTDNFSIGRLGDYASLAWNGYIDEFRYSVGVARWTANFTPPVVRYPYELLAGPQVPANDEPLLFQFTEQSLSEVVIDLAEGSEAARAAVVYLGLMLIMPRGVDVDADYLVPRFARKTEFATPRSERGDYLGKIVTSQWIDEVTHTYSHLEADFIRDEIDPFIASVQADAPFFYAILADDGVSYDVAYLTFNDDPMPQKNPVTKRYKLSMKMGGIVE